MTNDIEKVEPQERESPALAYLAGLCESSRDVQYIRLKGLIEVLGGKEWTVETFPWHRLTVIELGVLRTLLMQKYSNHTCNNMVSILRRILRICWLQGYYQHQGGYRHLQLLWDSLQFLPTNGSKRGRYVERSEIGHLMMTASKLRYPLSIRMMAMLAVLFEAGLRRSELCNLDLEDYSNKTLHIRKTKGHTSRYVPVDRCAVRLDEWIKVRGNWPGPLFCPITRKKRLHPYTINMLLEKLCYVAQVDDFTPHDARRTYISMLLATGSDISLVGALAGHRNPITTMQYDRRPVEARVEAVARLQIPFEDYVSYELKRQLPEPILFHPERKEDR